MSRVGECQQRTANLKISNQLVCASVMADPNLRHTDLGSFIDLQQHANGDEIVSRDYYHYQSEPLPHQTISPDHLGSGGYGNVFKAKCVKPPFDMIALKRSNRSQLKVFKQEWAANLRVQNTAHVTRFLQLIVTNNYVYLAFELMGPELFEAITAANPGKMMHEARM